MLRSVGLLLLYLTFLGLGTASPFIFSLGYIWVDTFRPQEVTYLILDQLPVAMIMGAAAIGGYFLLDRRDPPGLTLVGVVPAFMAGWCTITMLWAVAPESGWVKWDWAFKTLVFSAFLPLVIRSRVQIEAVAQVYLFALAGNIIPFGIKTIFTGGGYGMNLGLIAGNAGLAEGGQLSTFCLMAVPIAVYLAKHNRLVPRTFLTPIGYLSIAILAVITAVGTFERSALIGLAVLAIYMFLRSRRKVLFGIALTIGAAALIYASSAIFIQRMETIQSYQADSSAMLRLAVWRWTLEFSFVHPLGGGFNSYLVNVIDIPPSADFPSGITHQGRAFHSSYFEVLGEQGWPGFIMFVLAAASTIFHLRRLSKRTRNVPHLAWCADLSDALQSGVMVFFTSGAFVGIAFQPIIWYFFAISVSLREYVRRVSALEKPTREVGWRGALQPATPVPSAEVLPIAGGWRER